MSSGTYTVDELAIARTPDQLKQSIKESILNGDTVKDDDCQVNLRTVINHIDDHLIIELISRIDKTNPAYSKYMAAIDEQAEKVASDLTDKFKLVF